MLIQWLRKGTEMLLNYLDLHEKITAQTILHKYILRSKISHNSERPTTNCYDLIHHAQNDTRVFHLKLLTPI